MTTRTLSEEKKRQQKLLIILIAVILVALIFLYFAVWSKKSNTVIVEDINNILPGENAMDINTGNTQLTQKQLSSVILEEKLKKVDLNLDFLNQTILPFLKLYGDLPVKRGETGRSNPFIP